MAETDQILLYNTLTGSKQPFRPIEAGKCGIYCCGPTVYDMSHIGHARAAIAPDVLVRFLRHRGFEVTYVRNITDVDDKIIRRANERGVESTEVSERYTEEYLRDLDDLNVLLPEVQPKVTEHIGDIIDLVSTLVDKDLAYAVDGDVYYRVHSFPTYGKLSKRKLEDLKSGARVDVDDRKEDPADFALWKAAKPEEPSWTSPWGEGRPGWHIECSAMSMRHLGPDFDIHCGGRDLIFPHHENEIAQSQGANGEDTYARYWVHNGFVNFAGEKMSKSLGNFFTIREVTALYHPEVLRFFLLTAHYRRGVNFDVELRCPACGADMGPEEQKEGKCEACGHAMAFDELKRQVRFPGLEEADERLAYVYETLLAVDRVLSTAKDPGEGEVSPSVASMLERVDRAMQDDLNTAQAIAEISEPLSEANRLAASGKGVNKKLRIRTLRRFAEDVRKVAGIFGCFERDPREWLLERRDLKARRIGLEVERVETLLVERGEARKAKDFERADAIRAELAELGVEIRDFAGETTWVL